MRKQGLAVGAGVSELCFSVLAVHPLYQNHLRYLFKSRRSGPFRIRISVGKAQEWAFYSFPAYSYLCYIVTLSAVEVTWKRKRPQKREIKTRRRENQETVGSGEQ